MKTPSFLKKGDSVAIVATARKISNEDMQPAIDILRSWGLKVVLSKNLFKQEDQYAGSDIQRAKDLQSALNDPAIKAVFCARGGYGTVRIIDDLNFSAFKKKPKWIVGYSDITVLHSHLNTLGISSLHATMPINFTKNMVATETLRATLFGEKINYSIEKHSLNIKGICEGELVGGNLSLLYSLAATPSDIKTKGKILFIEDLDEYLYHIDRMMHQLDRSGKLKNLKGLIVGGMTDMKDNAIPFGKTAEEIIYNTVKKYKYPVCFNFPAGHIDKNLAMVFGKKVKLEVGKEVKFSQ